MIKQDRQVAKKAIFFPGVFSIIFSIIMAV